MAYVNLITIKIGPGAPKMENGQIASFVVPMWLNEARWAS
jgi:hypothetical protein